MSDNQSTDVLAPENNDGSVAMAAELLGGALQKEIETEDGITRDESGRFAKGQDDNDQDAPADTDKDADATDDDADAQKAKSQDDDGEQEKEFFEVEIPGEDGADPTTERYEVSEVWEKAQRADDLAAELEAAKTNQPLPADFEAATEQLVAQQAQYLSALQQWSHFNPVQPPNEALIDPNSEVYNPERYHQELQAFQQGQAQHQQAQQEYQRVSKEVQDQQAALANSKRVREVAKIKDFWPEVIANKSTADKVKSDLEKHYGLDQETIASVQDARFYRMAKDALAFRSNETARKEAVRVVKSKPKLVRAKARSTTTAAQAKASQGMQRLAKSGSLEDAADALGGLI